MAGGLLGRSPTTSILLRRLVGERGSISATKITSYLDNEGDAKNNFETYSTLVVLFLQAIEYTAEIKLQQTILIVNPMKPSFRKQLFRFLHTFLVNVISFRVIGIITA